MTVHDMLDRPSSGIRGMFYAVSVFDVSCVSSSKSQTMTLHLSHIYLNNSVPFSRAWDTPIAPYNKDACVAECYREYGIHRQDWGMSSGLG